MHCYCFEGGCWVLQLGKILIRCSNRLLDVFLYKKKVLGPLPPGDFLKLLFLI